MTLNKNSILLADKKKILYSKLLDAIIFIALFFVIYYSASYQILKATSYKNDLTLKENYATEVINIGVESKLYEYDEETKVISTVESVYTQFIYRNIKLCYEKYPEIYKEDLETYGYDDETFKNIDIETYENGHLSQFYLNFIIDKVDKHNNKIVNYTEENKYEYYVLNVLKVKDEGSEFFDYVENDYETLPRLKKDICRYLFQYNVKNISYSTLRTVDSNFYNFFVSIYQEAGDLLMKYDSYNNAFNNYEYYYELVNKELLNTVLITFLISFIILYIVVPQIFKNNMTLGRFFLKIVKLSNEKEYKIKGFFIETLFNLIKCFCLFAFFTLVAGGLNLVNFKFLTIGIVTISSLHVSLLAIIYSFISFIFLLARKTNDGLSEMAAGLYYYEDFSTKIIT